MKLPASSMILVVDEVLAVGDVEFQKKCLGKMGGGGETKDSIIAERN